MLEVMIISSRGMNIQDPIFIADSTEAKSDTTWHSVFIVIAILKHRIDAGRPAIHLVAQAGALPCALR